MKELWECSVPMQNSAHCGIQQDVEIAFGCVKRCCVLAMESVCCDECSYFEYYRSYVLKSVSAREMSNLHLRVVIGSTIFETLLADCVE